MHPDSETQVTGRGAAVPLPAIARAKTRGLSGEERFGLILVLPSIIVLLCVSTIPLLFLVGSSLYRIELTRPWVGGFAGLSNYAVMLADPRFWHSMRITVLYTLVTVVLQVVLGLAFAVTLAADLRGKNLLRTAVLLPMVLAPVVVGLVWRTLLLTPRYGLLDYLATTLGIGSHSWLGDPRLALASVIALHTWQWTPFAFLVFSASLAALPVEPYEAAMLDRASAWQRFRYITLPLLRPAIVTIVILRIIIALRAFDAIYAATGGGPGTATEILNLYAYRASFTSLNLGYGATLTATLLLLTAMMTFAFNRLRTSAQEG